MTIIIIIMIVIFNYMIIIIPDSVMDRLQRHKCYRSGFQNSHCEYYI